MFLASTSTDPQKSAPCITAVGYNGVQLLQNDGFIDAETLATNLQKAWLSLHLQETLLTAALVSENSAPQLANSSLSTTREQGDSSGVNIASSSVDGQDIENSGSLKNPDKDHKEMDINLGKNPPPEPVSINTLVDCKIDVAASVERSKASVNPDKSDVKNTELGDKAIDCEEEVAPSIERSKVSRTPDKSDANNNELGDKAIEDKQDSVVHNGKVNPGIKTENSQVSVVTETDNSLDDRAKESETESKPTDVHLNIRLLDGATLQNKFLLTSTLRMVKHYVDENQTIVRGSYDLAIPYPRKVFKDQDLDQTLLELGLVGRQALIVIRCDQSSSSSHGQTSLTRDNDSPNNNNEGYFSYLKWILSYANPLSYLGGGARSSNSAQETPGNVSQYGPAGYRSNLRGTDATSSSNQSTNSSKKATPRFGSNIHTLKHDDEDDKSTDRNKFWNGNSTQYGGDDDRK